MGIFNYPVTDKQDFSSLLTEIDRILAKVISSLVNPQEVTSETIIATRQQLESARALLSPLLLPDPTPEVARWSWEWRCNQRESKLSFFGKARD